MYFNIFYQERKYFYQNCLHMKSYLNQEKHPRCSHRAELGHSSWMSSSLEKRVESARRSFGVQRALETCGY